MKTLRKCPECGRRIQLDALGTDVEGRKVLVFHYVNLSGSLNAVCVGSYQSPEALKSEAKQRNHEAQQMRETGVKNR